jgi:hypothetical protein
MVVLVAGTAVAACGCGASVKTHVTPLPPVVRPSAAFAARVDRVCERASRALERTANSDTAPLTAMVAILQRQVRQLERLHPPQRERAAYSDLVGAYRNDRDSSARMVVYPNGILEILEQNVKPNDKVIVALSRRLRAMQCTAEVAPVARKPKAKRP